MEALKGLSIDAGVERTTDPEDLQWCAHLMSINEPWITLQRNYDHSIKLLEDPLSEVYILKSGLERLGFIMIKLKGAFTGYIQTIVIKAEARGKGIGEAAIKYVETLIFKESPNVFICVSSFNPGALKLYKQLGYEEVGVIKDYIIKGYDEILLRKTLGPLHDFKR
jgi:ribosomal protein S18 acetylase RimI-like enzyme